MENGRISQSKNHAFTVFILLFLITIGKYSIYIGFSFKPYMIFLLLFIFIHLAAFRFVRLQFFEILMLVFYLMYSFSGAFALYSTSSLRILIGIIIYLSCYFIIKSILSYSTQSIIEKGISYAGILFNGLSIVLYLIGLQALNFQFDLGERVIAFGVMVDRSYPRLIGLVEDPNFYVFYNTIFFAYYLCNSKSSLNKLGLFLCIITSILTFSRGGLLVIGILFFLYFIMSNIGKQLKMLMISVSLSLVAIYISLLFSQLNVIEMLDSRFGDFSNDGGSGRFELWGRAIDFFSTNILVGIGAFNFSDYNDFYYGDNLSVHNTFFDILSESGVLGFFFYMLFILFVFIQLIQNNVHRKKPYLFFTYIGYVLQLLSLSVIINDMFFMYLAILSIYIKEVNDKKGSSEKNKRVISMREFNYGNKEMKRLG
ncbi:O-antigen ligase family protein [Evansella sp. AB-P1]|uniref:O-antigen ligase family protein n=1 Tax=Evansella sp. AB-P1 TaxID=3037653 RepID=UPI00241DC9B3|nr:O-antigen ligase family protein [Evansella sp. AB-P1]MDG5787889.1 O-antigen ligase family protein [Evansella sp. AB-P1]